MRGDTDVTENYTLIVLVAVMAPQFALAAGDPLTVINNLSTFIFSLIRAIGMILLGFGIVQVGLSLKSHDPSQRANGFMTLVGGVIFTFAKEILELIVGLKIEKQPIIVYNQRTVIHLMGGIR